MIQSKNNRIRAKSAKTYQQRKRPLSSHVNKQPDKTQLVHKIYSNIPTIQQRPSSSRQKPKVNSILFSSNLYNLQAGTLQKEALIEENLQLKKKTHVLQEQMARMHGKIQASKAKTSKYAKNLNIEFQNQNLWTGKSSYLVTGVKNQYQNLKIKYKQKCEELNALQNLNINTFLKQVLKQNQFLRKQNIKLIQNHAKQQNLKDTLRNANQIGSKGLMNQQSIKANQLLINELSFKISKIQQKIEKRNSEIQALKQQLNIEQSKIKFLQKLIIEKDNSLHALNRKNKKLEKEKVFYGDQIFNLNAQIDQIKLNHEQQLIGMKSAQQKKINYERNIYHKSIEQKSVLIQKLQKQVAYLTTLLSYWKPLDEQNSQVRSPSKKQKNIELQQKTKQQQERKKQVTKQLQSLNMGKSLLKASMDLQKAEVKQQKDANLPRQQNRADKKRSQKAEKVRKVKQSQVQEIGEVIRFRLIAQRIASNQAKDFFSFTKNSANIDQQHAEWSKQYISMKQARQILMSNPFDLNSEQAHLFSRYLVQDVTNDYIYCDEENQNKRGIVKSILKSIIGDYQVLKSPQQIQKQCEIELGKYKGKISTILQQMYPGGLISKKKLLEIFVGSGFQIVEDILQYIIGKLAMKSESLANLNYGILF